MTSENRKGRDLDEIEKVIAEFDFDKVHKAMVAVDWKWGGSFGDTARVPTKEELVSTARGLLQEAAKGRTGTVSSGGFCAGYEIGEDRLGLLFILADA